MPKYLIKVNYSPEGARGIAKEGGTSRRDYIDKLLRNSGGTLESFNFAFGQDDAFVICDMPDNVTTASIGLTINSSGVVHLETVALLTPEEMDEATRKTVDYRPPGA